MPVTKPLVSARKLTPSSTGESGPTSGVAGTAVLAQIVRWVCAKELNEQPKTAASVKSASLTYFNFFGLDVPPGISAPNRSNLRCGAHKNKNSSLRIRTATPPVFLWVFGSPGRLLGIVATNRKERVPGY